MNLYSYFVRLETVLHGRQDIKVEKSNLCGARSPKGPGRTPEKGLGTGGKEGFEKVEN